MKGKEIEKVPHCIIRFYHNLWYKKDKSPQLFHKLIQTGELEMRENLYNEKIQKIEYNHTFELFYILIFQSKESTYFTKNHIISEEESDEEGNGEYYYIKNAIPYYFEECKNNNGFKDMKIVDFVKNILRKDNTSFSNPLETHCFDISFPEYMCYDTLKYKNVQLC